MEYGGHINITNGKLILNGNAASAVDGYVNVMGVITGYSDTKKVYWDYNVTTAGKTTVWAQNTPREETYSEEVLHYTNFGMDTFDMNGWQTLEPISDGWFASATGDVPLGTSGSYSIRANNNKEASSP